MKIESLPFKILKRKKYKSIKYLSFNLNKDEKLEGNKNIEKNVVEIEQFACEIQNKFFKTLTNNIGNISSNRLLASYN